MILTLGQKISKTKTKYLLKKTLSIAWIPISLIIQTKILRKQYKISKNTTFRHMNSNGLLLLCLYWFLLQTLSRILNLLPWLQQWKPVFYLIWIVKQRRRKKECLSFPTGLNTLCAWRWKTRGHLENGPTVSLFLQLESYRINNYYLLI